MVYFYDDGDGHVMPSGAPTGTTVAAIDTPPFSLPVNAYAWAMDEAVSRGLLEWDSDRLRMAETYDKAKAFDPF